MKNITEQASLSPRVKKLRGIIKVEQNLNDKQILIEELTKKYNK
jgi:hypothetical protein